MTKKHKHKEFDIQAPLARRGRWILIWFGLGNAKNTRKATFLKRPHGAKHRPQRPWQALDRLLFTTDACFWSMPRAPGPLKQCFYLVLNKYPWGLGKKNWATLGPQPPTRGFFFFRGRAGGIYRCSVNEGGNSAGKSY